MSKNTLLIIDGAQNQKKFEDQMIARIVQTISTRTEWEVPRPFRPSGAKELAGLSISEEVAAVLLIAHGRGDRGEDLGLATIAGQHTNWYELATQLGIDDLPIILGVCEGVNQDSIAATFREATPIIIGPIEKVSASELEAFLVHVLEPWVGTPDVARIQDFVAYANKMAGTNFSCIITSS